MEPLKEGITPAPEKINSSIFADHGEMGKSGEGDQYGTTVRFLDVDARSQAEIQLARYMLEATWWLWDEDGRKVTAWRWYDMKAKISELYPGHLLQAAMADLGITDPDTEIHTKGVKFYAPKKAE